MEGRFDEETGAPLTEEAAQLVAKATAAVAPHDTGPGGAAGGAAAVGTCRQEGLASVAPVAIAPGKWKYVQIELRDGDGATKRIVRSFAGRKFHADMFEKAMQELEPLGLRGGVIGGGRIEYDTTAKTVNVYGYSKTFGRAAGCNKLSASLISQFLPECQVTWSDDGY
eukprot:COSAG02_NODE_1503_length_12252_cov_7.167133_2_plen_168_part_00